MTLEEFLVQTQADVQAMVNEQVAAESWLNPETAFTEIVMQHMSDCGMTFEPTSLRIERKIGPSNIKLNGYAVSDDADQVDLFVTIYRAADKVETIPDSDVTRVAEQCIKFLGQSADGRVVELIDPSDDAYEFSHTIKSCYPDLDQVRVYVLTDMLTKTKIYKSREVAGKSVKLEVMDIERLYRHWSEGKPRDELVVNFEDVCGTPLPCVYVPGENEDYDYALTAIPGQALRLLYERYGARLLEANVRSFLSQTGKVNKGIRETLRDTPERFMAYNNGIVVIADEVSLGRALDGSTGLSWLKGMQIVNGGQTTASIYFTKRKNPETDLSRVRVPAKIIVLHRHDPDAEEALIGDISRYANSQNAVKVSDLSANKPFHVEVEKLANSTYCPDGTGRWFYERATGSYNVLLAREGTTPAKLKKLKDSIPPARKITKTDLAKYLQAWAGRADLVSLGNQKNFDRFMADAASEGLPDVSAFKEMIAKAIIFKATHKIVNARGYPQAKANITVYSVSALSHLTKGKLALDTIWQRQAVSPQLHSYIGDIVSGVEEALRKTAGSRQISEWAKKEECLRAVMSSSFRSPPTGIPELSR